jgi:maleylacetoacetate isomerase
MLTLYGYFRSSASYRVRIALKHKQIAFNNIEIHLIKNGGEQHAPDYQALNPQALVPVLVTEDNQVITQSLSILHYIEEKYPEPSLVSKDTIQQSQILSLCCQIACDIHPLNNLRVLQYLEKQIGCDEKQKDAWYHHWILKGFEALEATLADTAKKYCFIERLTWADCFLIPQVYNAYRFKVPMHNFPRIRHIYEYCLTLPEIQAASPENYSQD